MEVNMAQHILLIEDNLRDTELTRRALMKANIMNPLVVAEDGVEALKYFFGEDGESGCAADDLPVVTLLDLNLPKINGLELLARLRANEKTRRIPVVIFTSSNEEKDLIASYNLGANSFVRKPIKFADFAEAIKTLGLYWLILNQTAQNSTKI
jgi:two-component system, response regulator